jgi:hypothetical protein
MATPTLTPGFTVLSTCDANTGWSAGTVDSEVVKQGSASLPLTSTAPRVTVAGLWEFGYSTPIQELDLWQYPLREYGVTDFVMAPVSGIRSDFVTEVADLGEWLAQQDRPVVFVDEKGEVDLVEFDHPEDVIYVFGKASTSAFAAYGKGRPSVRIDTPGKTGMLWPHQVAVLVLHDRGAK